MSTQLTQRRLARPFLSKRRESPVATRLTVVLGMSLIAGALFAQAGSTVGDLRIKADAGDADL